MFKKILAVSLIVIATGCTPTTENTTPITTETKAPVALTSSAPQSSFDQLAKLVAEDTVAMMKTSMGDIKIKLFPKEAPKTVENFVGHSKKGYYNNLIFHRVINGFMIQGGDPKGNGSGGESIWGGSFEDEFSPNLKNLRGAISMANSGPNTNGSQFFIVQKEGGTPWLDGVHTVFGQVMEGMDVVDKIAATQKGKNDKPIVDVKINTIEIAVQK